MDEIRELTEATVKGFETMLDTQKTRDRALLDYAEGQQDAFRRLAQAVLMVDARLDRIEQRLERVEARVGELWTGMTK